MSGNLPSAEGGFDVFYERFFPKCLFEQVYQGSGIQVATDIEAVQSCRTIVDAKDTIGKYFEEPLNSPIAYDMRYEMDERDGMYNSIIQETSMARGGSSRINFRERKPPVQLRSFFPENWLFTIEEARDGSINK